MRCYVYCALRNGLSVALEIHQFNLNDEVKYFFNPLRCKISLLIYERYFNILGNVEVDYLDNLLSHKGQLSTFNYKSCFMIHCWLSKNGPNLLPPSYIELTVPKFLFGEQSKIKFINLQKLPWKTTCSEKQQHSKILIPNQ